MAASAYLSDISRSDYINDIREINDIFGYIYYRVPPNN
jgi:hypothetical protein